MSRTERHSATHQHLTGVLEEMETSKSATLPKIVYIGDVPVESSYHGSALLYRLLEDYPQDRLAIVECDGFMSAPERRLGGVAYHHLPPGRLVSRLLYSRLNRWGALLSMYAQSPRSRNIGSVLNGFKPDAVVTVIHGYGWLAAADFARRCRLPLHIIVHDDWANIAKLPSAFRPVLQKRLAQVYRQAVTRFCVSPAMEEEYLRRYGVPGDVLYPSRGSKLVSFESPPPPPPPGLRPFSAGFAGSLGTPSYVETLRLMAGALKELGGRLNIYGPVSAENVCRMGLNLPNVIVRGLIPSGDIVSVLREECDVLVVPMSFTPADLEPMRLNFPSKLTDCTATALPLLVVGPPSTSAIQWANDHPGVALTVTQRSPELMLNALKALANDPELRRNLGGAAAQLGSRQFSPTEARRKLHDRLLAAVDDAALVN